MNSITSEATIEFVGPLNLSYFKIEPLKQHATRQVIPCMGYKRLIGYMLCNIYVSTARIHSLPQVN